MRLDLSLEIDTAVRKLACGLLLDTAEQLQVMKNPDKAVHESRKNCKKLRAVLRAARPDLGDSQYKRANGAVRDLAGSLAPYREAAVQVASVETMAERFAEILPRNALDPAKRTLGHRHRQLMAELSRSGVARDAADTVRRLIEDIGAWPPITWKSLIQGFVDNYRRGKRDCKAVQHTADSGSMHDWRKRVKYLMYHVNMLEPLHPKLLTAIAADLDLLAEDLGQDHDLAQFQLLKGDDLDLDPAMIGDLQLAIAQKRRILKERALRRGRLLFTLTTSQIKEMLQATPHWR